MVLQPNLHDAISWPLFSTSIASEQADKSYVLMYSFLDPNILQSFIVSEFYDRFSFSETSETLKANAEIKIIRRNNIVYFFTTNCRFVSLNLWHLFRY